jgi:hypothetical protein
MNDMMMSNEATLVIVIGHSSIVGDFSQSANGIHGLFEI